MIKLGYIVKGDPLSNGGTVTDASGPLINNNPAHKIALLGDPVKCALHGDGIITQGHPKIIANEKPVAFAGYEVSCLCKLEALYAKDKYYTEQEGFLIDTPQKVKEFLVEFYSENKTLQEIDRKIVEVANILPNEVKRLKDFYCENDLNLFKKSKPKNIHIDTAKRFGEEYLCSDHEKRLDNNKKRIYYEPLQGTPKNLLCEDNLGGAHKSTRLPPKDGFDSHHIPPKSAYKGSKMYPPGAKDAYLGPAIKMSPEHHKETLSYGNYPEARKFQDEQRALIKAGRFKEAMQNDIDDIRRIAAGTEDPYQYECQIQQAIEYANTLNWDDFIVK